MSYDMTVQGSLAAEALDADEKAENNKAMTPSMRCEMTWDFCIPQATINVLVGKHGSCKGTLLKVLGEVLLPTKGSYFVPPQLRVYFVTQFPLFFYGSLIDNLVFGLE